MILSVLMILLCVAPAMCDLQCADPQKGFYMSYNALSKKDTMQNLFTEIDGKILTYNTTYVDPKNITYHINSFHPQLYYNEHHQV